MPLPRQTSPRYPTHAEIATFLETFLPPTTISTTNPSSNDVPFLYHSPRHTSYNPTRAPVSRVVFSITPTPGVYAALNAPGLRFPPVCFLHRPGTLDRRAVRRGSLMLACHKSFDERLTVGWKVELGRRLGADVAGAVCIQGYKGDDGRKIGFVGRVGGDEGVPPEDLVQMIRAEFHGIGDFHSPQATCSEGANEVIDDSVYDGNKIQSARIKILAVMNAFHEDEVHRVLAAAHSTGWISDPSNGRHVLYLTGAAREYGLEAAKKVNMPVVCVGHRACEEWGIRHLAKETKKRWPELEVVEVLEEEEQRRPKKVKTELEVKDGEIHKLESGELCDMEKGRSF